MGLETPLLGYVRPQPGAAGIPADALTFASAGLPFALQAAPRRDTVRFGHKPYDELYQQVTLRPEQQADVALIRQISASRSLARLPVFLTLLQSPNYQHLTKIKGRNAFHTPFTDLFFNLDNPREQSQLLIELEKAVLHAPSRLSQTNAINVMADIYFDVLCPGGRLDTLLTGAVNFKRRHQRTLQPQLLKMFDRMIDPLNSDPNMAWQARYQLRLHWMQYTFNRGWQPESSYNDAPGLAIRRQVVPLITRLLPERPIRPQVSAPLLQKLEAALRAPNADDLRAMSASGELIRLIPEWARLTGTANIQHTDQDFNLADHCLNAVEFAKKSPYYKGLSDREKRLVSITALLHDVGKDSGPSNLHAIIAVDRPHPLKSEAAVHQILPSLGFTPEEIDIVARLARHHQMLGAIVTRNPDSPPPDSVLEQAATLVPSVSELRMLQAITEGDIRGVKKNSGWFTPGVEERLNRYGRMIEARIRRNRASDYSLSTQNPQMLVPGLWAQRNASNSVVAATMDELLDQMSAQWNRVGYSMEDQIYAFRMPDSRTRQWLTMSYRDAGLNAQIVPGNSLADGLYDHSLKMLNLWNSYDFRETELPYGFIVDVPTENIAYIGSKNDFAAKPVRQILDADHAFRQVVNGKTDSDDLEALWLKRMDNAYQPVSLVNTVSPVVLATRPVIKGVYYHQKRADEKIRLPRELQQFIRSNRLPVAILR